MSETTTINRKASAKKTDGLAKSTRLTELGYGLTDKLARKRVLNFLSKTWTILTVPGLKGTQLAKESSLIQRPTND
jgi:hypothetical protein